MTDITTHKTDVADFWYADGPARLDWVTWTRATGGLVHQWRARDPRNAAAGDRGRTVLATTGDQAEADRLARSALTSV